MAIAHPTNGADGQDGVVPLPADQPTHIVRFPGSAAQPVAEPQTDEFGRTENAPLVVLVPDNVGGLQHVLTADFRTAILGPAGVLPIRSAEHADELPQPVEAPAEAPLVVAHAYQMGLHNIPVVAAVLTADFASGEICADAICEALQPFAHLGLNLVPVRQALLSRASRTPALCHEIGGRTFLVLGPCGSGGIGSTYFVADVNDPQHLLVMKRVSVSRMDANAPHEMDMARREPEVLREAGELVAAGADDQGHTYNQLTVMPFREGPSLQSLLVNSPGRRLQPKVACWLALSIARELKRVGDVWHLDLKGSNIIISPELRAQLIDYGAGRIAPRDGDSQQLGLFVQQTPFYSPPEVSAAEPSAHKTSDVYSLALLLYEMLSGETAVSVDDQLQALALVGAAQEFKVGPSIDGPKGIQKHLNVPKVRVSPNPDPRALITKFEQATDWAHPYTDAGAKVREVLNQSLQTDPGKRFTVDRLIASLEQACRELHMDVRSGPPIDDAVRDETRLIGRQVTPQALLAAIIPADNDPYLTRVDHTK